MNTPNTLLIYTWHLMRQHLRTAIFWTIGLGLYTALIVLSFPSFRDSGALAMENFPEAIMKAFNIQDMTQIGPFLDSQVISYAPLVIAFFAIMAFAGAIAGAEERGAVDIILGNPIPRWHIVLANWITIAILLVGILFGTAVITWGAARLVDVDLRFVTTLQGMMNMFPITMAFGSLALALSARLRSRGAVIGISFAVVFLMYLIDIIGKISSQWAGLRWISAFRYYGSAIVNGLNRDHIAILLTAAVVLLIVAIALFDRRDVYT